MARQLTATPLIRAIAAVIVAVALPPYWNAAMVVTPEISQRITGHGLCL